MSSSWYDYVFDHLEELARSNTRADKALLALFSLDGEFNNGGLIQYLMNESGDTWALLKDAFELGNCPRGIEWMSCVEEAFGGAMPRERDTRLDLISAMQDYRNGKDPFEDLDRILGSGLMDDVQEIGEKLVRSRQA